MMIVSFYKTANEAAGEGNRLNKLGYRGVVAGPVDKLILNSGDPATSFSGDPATKTWYAVLATKGDMALI